MIENMKEFWYLYVLLFVLIIITVFVCKKAFAASSRHSKHVNELIAKAKKEKQLREAYSVLTEEIIANAPADSLFHGTGLNLEYTCQNVENADSFYALLNDEQKDVYALYYLFSDCKNGKLSDFFSNSSRPLTTDALGAAKKLFDGEICDIITSMFNSYDEENEDASVIAEEIERLDSSFADLTADKDFFALGGEYIKANAKSFI